MIAIYHARPDRSRFATIMPSERSFDESNRRSLLKFNGERKSDAWGPRRYCCVREPAGVLGDFAGFSIQALAVRVATFGNARLAELFNNRVCELLPLVDESNGAEWYVLDMMHVDGCVDRERSEISIVPYRRRLEFRVDTIVQQNVFTPSWPRSLWRTVLCWERDKDQRSEFKARVEQSGMTGLEFELLWDEKDGGITFVAEPDPEAGIVIRGQDQ